MIRLVIDMVRLVIVLVIALAIGIAAAAGVAMLSHEVLVLAYGEDLAPIDDTLPMFLAVVCAYGAGFVAGVVALVVGWRRIRSARLPGS